MAARTWLGRATRATAIASLCALCLVVTVVGAIAAYASVNDTWIWLFRMERAANAAGPVVTGLAVVTVVAGVGAALTVE